MNYIICMLYSYNYKLLYSWIINRKVNGDISTVALTNTLSTIAIVLINTFMHANGTSHLFFTRFIHYMTVL